MSEPAIYFLALLSGMLGCASVDIGRNHPNAGRLISMTAVTLAIIVGSMT